jgi:FkbM family methyltransferase
MRGMKWISGSGTHGCWLGSYEYQKQRRFDEAIAPGSMVWDIGANVGLYTLLASRRAARVVAVEPLPENLVYMEKHLRLNGISNVEVVAAAVGQERGRQSFCTGENRSVGHLGVGTSEVDVITLDSMIKEYGSPGVIKIDVEGAEYSVLQGAKQCLAAGPKIFLATHSPELANQCCAFLRSIGYEYTQIGEDELLCSRHLASRQQS